MRWGLILLSVTVTVILSYLGALGWFIIRLAGEQKSHLAWQLPLGTMRDLVPDILPDGTICCGADQKLHWINPDGSVAAQYDGGALMEYGCSWFAGAGNLWFVGPVGAVDASGQRRARLMAFNKQAQVEWERQLPQGSQVENICLGRELLMAQLDSGFICCIDLQGHLLWAKQLETRGYGGMAVSPAGELYFVNSKHELVCVTAAGTERWRVALPATAASRPEISPTGIVYVLDDNSMLHAISAEGVQLWSMSPPAAGGTGFEEFFGGGMWGSSGGFIGNGFVPAAAADGSVYFCNWDGRLYAVSPQGKLKWSRRLGGECTAPAIGNDGTVYVAIAGQGVRAYSPQGKLLWRNSGVREINSAPIIGRDGKLYVDTYDSLVAFFP